MTKRAARFRTVSAGPPFGAVLLDLDGCLIASNDAHARAWSEALRRFGRSVPSGTVRFQVGKGGSEMLRDLVSLPEHYFLASAMGATETDIFLRRFRDEVRPLPGAAAAVRAMRRASLAVVLASSAERRVIDRAVSLLRLGSVLTGATSADDVKKTKPFHDVFSLAVDRYRLSGRRPVAVGDTPYDIAAAHQMGLPCVALLSGGFPRESLRTAEWVCRDLPDLWQNRRELFAR
jgi:beta-phosphoglucomutase-like phosphatase (HAD superfamily)